MHALLLLLQPQAQQVQLRVPLALRAQLPLAPPPVALRLVPQVPRPVLPPVALQMQLLLALPTLLPVPSLALQVPPLLPRRRSQLPSPVGWQVLPLLPPRTRPLVLPRAV